MPNNNLLLSDSGAPVPGPELAVALFLLLVVYALGLLAANSGAFPRLHWLTARTVRRDLTIGLGLLATVPAIALALVLASQAAGQREDRARELLQESTNAVAAKLDQFFEKHRIGISALASGIERSNGLDVQSLSEALLSHHLLYPDYLTMLAANTFGDIVTATTMVQGEPARISSLTHNISDRPYFVEPMQDGGAYVSDVFQGRGLGHDPIVAVSSVVLARDGTPWGIVEGSLNLQQLTRFHPRGTAFDQNIHLHILDNRNRVVYSSNTDIYQTLDIVGVPHLDTADTSRLRAESVTDMGWRVFTSISRMPVHSQVWADARVTLLWLLGAIAVAVLLSAAIASRVTRPLQALKQAVRALDLEGVDARLEPPAGAPEEMRQVFDHLSSMSQRLQNSYRQLTAAVEAGKHYREQLETTLSRREADIHSRTRELEHSNRNLRALSNVDQLTGLANRRRLNEGADQAWRHCMREQRPVSIVLIDVDHFKPFNDTYGHQQGDRCLAQIGGALSACVWRPLDLVARYGGEEFIMILANTDLTDALNIAERTRRVIEEMRLPHDTSPHGFVSVSAGVAAAVPQRGTTHDGLLQRADEALYFAKEKGRNRVAWANADEVFLATEDTPASAGDQVVEFPHPVTEND